MRKSVGTKENIDWVVMEISQARTNGLRVMIDGIYCDSAEEVNRMLLIREEESYMKDYMGDEKGKIIGIAFDKIKIRNE